MSHINLWCVKFFANNSRNLVIVIERSCEVEKVSFASWFVGTKHKDEVGTNDKVS